MQDHGRKKPFTTFAHEMLLALSGHATYTLDNADGTKTALSPEKVVLDLWFKPDGWDDRPLIMINFLELKQKLGLPETQKLFSFNELIKKQPLMDMLGDAQKQRQAGKSDTLPAVLKEAEQLGQRMQLFRDLVQGAKETIVPSTKSDNAAWSPAFTTNGAGDSLNLAGAANTAFTPWMQAWADGDIAKFNAQTFEVVSSLRAVAPQFYPSADALRFEHTYMAVDPFMWAWIIYFCALLVLLLTAIWAQRGGYMIAWALTLIGMGLEIYGFASRIIISGRPPVTDLYETVIWVSFIGMVFAVILEAVYRKRYFLYAGLPAAILTLIVADSDSTILDASINPLTAVLRNNMWLTIHVLTIVSSYAAFVLTAALAHIALGDDLLGQALRQGAGRGALLYLSRHADRHPAARDRHDSRRRLGQLFVGPLLGLGPEGNVGADHACSATSRWCTAGSPVGGRASGSRSVRWSVFSR